MRFDSVESAERFKEKYAQYLEELCEYALGIEIVAYADIWLNGNMPSFVAGYNSDDVLVVCIRIQCE